MIRSIRFLGAAFGALIGLTTATYGNGLFTGVQYYGAFLAAWVIAWIVIGFGIFPYLTSVPAGWLLRQVQMLSTAEFVTAVGGNVLGLVTPPALGEPRAHACPFGSDRLRNGRAALMPQHLPS